MKNTVSDRPVAPGEPAPDFALPAVADGGTVALADYRGSSPLFLALTIGLWCPFCRRQLVQLGALEGRLKAIGVRTLAVVATAPDNARLYFKFRPTSLRLASDPQLQTHRAYGVPKPVSTPEMLRAMDELRINPNGYFAEPLPVAEAAKVLQQQDGYVYTKTDEREVKQQWPQLKALFMIDREGIVRWANVECADEGLAGLGKMPTEETIIGAARACAG